MIIDIKVALEGVLGHSAALIRLFNGGHEKSNLTTLGDCGIGDGSKLFAALDSVLPQQAFGWGIQLFGEFKNDDSRAKDLVEKCLQGMLMGVMPRLAQDGSGGTYVLRDASHTAVAVFKPEDEEPFAPNNPKRYVGTQMFQRGLRKGISSGEAASREVAAFILDTGSFSGVPFTTRVEACHPSFCYRNHDRHAPLPLKVGSLQSFVEYTDTASDFGPQVFPNREVHKIGILDIRLVNTDRNDGNILVQNRSSQTFLIPVDHGYCLPDVFEIAWCDWVWIHWPQAQRPFDQETLDFIDSIDIDGDVQLLRQKLSIRDAPLQIMRMTCMTLKIGAAAGLNLYEIATIIARDNLDAPSLLETIVLQAKALALSCKKKQKEPPSLVRSTSSFDISMMKAGVSSPASDSKDCPLSSSSEALWDSVFWKYFDILIRQVIDKKASVKAKFPNLERSLRYRRYSYSLGRDS